MVVKAKAEKKIQNKLVDPHKSAFMSLKNNRRTNVVKDNIFE